MSENTIDTVIKTEENVKDDKNVVDVEKTPNVVTVFIKNMISRLKKTSVKDIVAFVQTKILTENVYRVALLSLGGLLTLLCVIQVALWGVSLGHTYLDYWKAIETFDFINIAIMAFMVMFLVILFVNIVRSVVFLIKKDHVPQFKMVTTLFSFYLFSVFVAKLFAEDALLISNFVFSPTLQIMLIVAACYALIRLFGSDFGARIWPFVFSCAAVLVSCFMYSKNIGNFATFSLPDSAQFSLADLNIYKFIQALIQSVDGMAVKSNIELLFYECSSDIDVIGLYMEEEIIFVALQLISIFVANVLPFAAISLIGYLIYGLVDKNYMQYYYLQSCKKVAITMLVVSIFSMLSVIGMNFVCSIADTYLTIQIHYTNMITTFILCILMIVLTWLPWKIYNITFNHRYSLYQKSKGGN